MKDRAKVICHMMTTIDGKISINFDDNKDYQKVGMEYDRMIRQYGRAWGVDEQPLSKIYQLTFPYIRAFL